ncbi:hypothetical protein E6Q11_04520 [Candidatus Dojkabacteria bacterium]|uniref:Uncharacterized protein n=1 Tax=Candidatus Dojkabacteria bacterium TaxID=2099670 RepID=A0A5C7J4S3_9BACT|nr:MAG: hypothetical protein E6Q11_04520 [Candidatus Dojkabacteria bacterium]
MTIEYDRPEYTGIDPREIEAEAMALRPVPAVEKTVGRKEPIVVYDVKLAEAWAGWNDIMRGRERG